MVIDCEEIAKAKNDAGLVSALADQTGELSSPFRAWGFQLT